VPGGTVFDAEPRRWFRRAHLLHSIRADSRASLRLFRPYPHRRWTWLLPRGTLHDVRSGRGHFVGARSDAECGRARETEEFTWTATAQASASRTSLEAATIPLPDPRWVSQCKLLTREPRPSFSTPRPSSNLRTSELRILESRAYDSGVLGWHRAWHSLQRRREHHSRDSPHSRRRRGTRLTTNRDG